MIRVKVALVNDSTVLNDDEVALHAEAFQKQVRSDLRHYWLCDAVVYFSPKGQAIAPDTWEVHYQDGLDVDGALGYHDLTKGDVPVSLIGAQIDLDHGYSPSVTASHEVCEMLVDPYVASAWQISDSVFVATEVGDPVEADEFGYTIHTRLGDPILVSDFVTPHWFQAGAPPPYDFAGHLTAPLTLLPGGYASVWSAAEGWQQVTAEKASQRAVHSLRSWQRASVHRHGVVVA